MKKTNTKRFLLAASLIAAMLAYGINTAFGLAQITLTVKNPNPYEGNQSWFVYEKEPGQTIEDIATVKNFSNEPAEVKVYAVDASSSESGSFILSFLHDKQQGIGNWTDVSTKSLTIPPFDVIDVPFSIQIPDDITPGQYLGGIVVENGSGTPVTDSSGTVSSGTSISVKTRVGARVYLTIPGEVVENIQFTGFEAKKDLSGETKFYLTLDNRGNVAYEPKVRIDVYSTSGALYESIEKSIGIISPNSIIKPVITMDKRPLMGNFTAKATVVFNCKFMPENLHGSAHTLTSETVFWAIPWEIIFTVLFFVFAVLAFVTNRRLARKKYFANSGEYVVGQNEDIVSIGAKTGTKWKKIARYNKLKAPYVVKTGDKIIVPRGTSKPEQTNTNETEKTQ